MSNTAALAKQEAALARELLGQVQALVKDLTNGTEDVPPGEETDPALDAPEEAPANDDVPADLDAEVADGAPEGCPPVEQLVEAFSQMDPEELQCWADAIAQAQAAAGSGDVDPNASEPPVDEGDGPGVDMGKSEVQAKAAADLLKAAELLSKSQSKPAPAPAKAPARRAATAPARSNVRPVQTLSKAEVNDMLLAKSRDASTTTRDRNLINGFYSGQVKLDQLNHLFTGSK